MRRFFSYINDVAKICLERSSLRQGGKYKFRDVSLNPGGLVLVHISSPNSCPQVTSLGIGNPELSRLKKGYSFGVIDFHLVMVSE
jgi:hypothetical protein